MLTTSRRSLLASAGLAAAFGLGKPLAFVDPADAETPLEPTTGFYKYNVGSIEITALYDGIWRKPHDPTFIKNASVEETKAALAKAGLTTEFMLSRSPWSSSGLATNISWSMPDRELGSGRQTPHICRPT
jgi:hypothetical protein